MQRTAAVYLGLPGPAVPASALDDEGKALRYWLLLGVPWRQQHAGSNCNQHCLSALGALFDSLNVRPQLLRKWASRWLEWSETHLRMVASAWHAACLCRHVTASLNVLGVSDDAGTVG